VTLDFLLDRLNSVISNLVIYPKNMMGNLNKFDGLIFSQAIMLKLTQKGLSREDANKIVQENAMKTWKTKENFKNNLKKDKLLNKFLSTKEIENIFNLKKHTKYVNTILNRTLR